MEKLKITELGIIYDENGFEMLLEKFLKKLEKKKKSRKYNVIYNEKGNNFYIVYDGNEYVLEVKDNGLDKKYSGVFSRLMKLSNAQPEIYKNCIEIVLDTEKREKILEDGEKGVFPNDEARAIYLEYLKRANDWLLDEYFFNYYVDGIETLRERKIFFVKASSFFAGVAALFSIVICKRTGTIIPFMVAAPLGFLVPTVFNDQEYSFIETLRQRRLIKHKIKELESELNKSPLNNKKIKSTNGSDALMLDKVKEYPYEFKDIICKKASSILDMIDCLSNDEEKQKLKNIIKKLLQEYSAGLKLSKNVGTVELNISRCNNINELQAITENGLVERLGGQLDKIGAEISRMLDKQITEMDREKERLLLEERLGPIVIDSEELEDVLREREDNLVPIEIKVCHKVKTRKVKSGALYR